MIHALRTLAAILLTALFLSSITTDNPLMTSDFTGYSLVYGHREDGILIIFSRQHNALQRPRAVRQVLEAYGVECETGIEIQTDRRNEIRNQRSECERE